MILEHLLGGRFHLIILGPLNPELQQQNFLLIPQNQAIGHSGVERGGLVSLGRVPRA